MTHSWIQNEISKNQLPYKCPRILQGELPGENLSCVLVALETDLDSGLSFSFP